MESTSPSWNKAPDLRVQLGPLELKNPITVASGTFGYGLEYKNYVDLNRLGAIFVKGLTLKPRSGHPQQRIAETASGMLNCIGLQNVGIDEFIKDKLPKLRSYDTAVIANINGSTAEEYYEISDRLTQSDGVAALEVNVSCPNVKAGGMMFGTDPFLIETITSGIRKRTHLPVIVKLSPNVTDIGAMAIAACNGGADILSLINTLVGMAVDVRTWRPVLSNLTGGLSGPAIKPVALRCVYETARAVSVPIIGMGGICSGTDVVEFLLVGAHAVSIGTASYIHPDASIRILDELIRYMIENRIGHISEITRGLKHENPLP
ncbi:dihydroorotate dehydrogenase [bacterium]|nr:dihydroorotate dehydrogenase [candidate division CSSED10-310 bacterium]